MDNHQVVLYLLISSLAKQETEINRYVLCQWVVAEFALGFEAGWRQSLDAGLRAHREHVLWTDLTIESAKGVQDVLFEGVVSVLSAGGTNALL